MPYSQLETLFNDAVRQYPVTEALKTKFGQLDNFVIKNFSIAFGNRILKQLDDFVPVYVGCGGREIDAFDFIFANKILKKFESINIAFFKDELKSLQTQIEKLFGKGEFKMSNAVIEKLLKNN